MAVVGVAAVLEKGCCSLYLGWATHSTTGKLYVHTIEVTSSTRVILTRSTIYYTWVLLLQELLGFSIPRLPLRTLVPGEAGLPAHRALEITGLDHHTIGAAKHGCREVTCCQLVVVVS